MLKNTILVSLLFVSMIVSVSAFEIVTTPYPTLVSSGVEPSSGSLGTLFRIKAELYDVSGVASSTAEIIRDGVVVSTAAMEKTNSTWSATWDSASRQGGNYKINITTCDTLGNCGEYENVAEFTIALCPDGTQPGSCSSSKPKKCQSNLVLADDCSACGCPVNYVCQNDGSCLGKCSDGTLSGQCSPTKPKYCDNGNLTDNCQKCGCNDRYSCRQDGSCLLLCSDGTPDGQCSQTKPKSCVDGNLADDCSKCGCPSGQQCSNNICRPVCASFSEQQCIGNDYCEPVYKDALLWKYFDRCVDATCSDGIKNQGETDIDCGGPCAKCVYCSDGTLSGQCSPTKPKKCTNGNLTNDCSKCGCATGMKCENNACVINATCTDGTPYNSCSSSKPKYCTNTGSLVNKCSVCGCNETSYCSDDGTTCLQPTCSDGKQNGNELGIDCGGSCPSGCSSCLGGSSCKTCFRFLFWNICYDPCKNAGNKWPFYWGNNAVKQAAQAALREYATYKGVSLATIDTSDEYMEAVAYYVNKHTTWKADECHCERKCILWIFCWNECGKGDWCNTQDAVKMITRSGSRGCGTDYCGDCEDHAVLREALLRSLGVKWECAWNADWFSSTSGHEYNIVNYKNKYRIMDYGQLGSYFTYRWYAHQTTNVYNDMVGAQVVSSARPATYTYNYPQSTSKCPSRWTYETVYSDVCP